MSDFGTDDSCTASLVVAVRTMEPLSKNLGADLEIGLILQARYCKSVFVDLALFLTDECSLISSSHC